MPQYKAVKAQFQTVSMVIPKECPVPLPGGWLNPLTMGRLYIASIQTCQQGLTMVTILTLIEEAKQALGVDSDNAFALKIGITRASVSHWRHGRSLPDTVTCATLAGLTGRPLAQVIGIVGEARAISREEKAVWRKLAATTMLLAVMVFPALPRTAQATTGWVKPEPVLCIMRNEGAGITSSRKSCRRS